MQTFKTFTDTELIVAYQSTKNAEAFGELYNRYNKRVILYCEKILKDHEQASDLTQDIFVKISTKIEGLKQPITFVRWLFKIAYNDCIDFLKQHKKTRYKQLKESNDLGEEDFDWETAFERENQLDKLQVILNEISKEDKKILLERYYNKKSILELMQHYDLSESAVKMRLARSRKRIKDLYLMLNNK